MKTQTQRDRLMIAGLFLSKFDRKGLALLGFASFTEAFNTIGYALGGKPASIKNYMQEFDPLFPNQRKGWHKRAMRDHCREAFQNYGDLPIETFFSLLAPLLDSSRPIMPDGMEDLPVFDEDHLGNETFSKRLITGAAAEGFFERSFPNLPEFFDHALANVTLFGCGFDFRIQPPGHAPYLAVEVKGMAGETGEIMMTAKEHRVANHLADRYYLCVVRNFAESPALSIFRNPLKSGLGFSLREQKQITQTWHARISA
jgi:hypothetical protein